MLKQNDIFCHWKKVKYKHKGGYEYICLIFMEVIWVRLQKIAEH